MKEVKMGGRFVGDGHPVLISLEAGATHTGIESAKQLSKAAADGSADAIKWQTVNADLLMTDHSQMVKYTTADGEENEESIYEALKRRELSRDEWHELKDYCDGLGLLFISTPDSIESIDLLVEIGADALKVSKSDINHFYMVDYMARTGKTIILDGREKFDDVERCVQICESHGVDNIIIMHCPSGYPAQHAGIHLSTITQIKNIFGYPAAYSDHSVGNTMNYAAIALGASMIEKTITLDKGTDAVEHSMSIEPHEVSEFVERTRAVQAALGDPRIIFNSRVKPDLRRSIFAKHDIAKGRRLALDDLDFRRPGTFYSAQYYEAVIGQEMNRDLKAGEPIMPHDLQ
jgi:N,N'-diacetyllegionaminate synthase